MRNSFSTVPSCTLPCTLILRFEVSPPVTCGIFTISSTAVHITVALSFFMLSSIERIVRAMKAHISNPLKLVLASVATCSTYFVKDSITMVSQLSSLSALANSRVNALGLSTGITLNLLAPGKGKPLRSKSRM